MKRFFIAACGVVLTANVSCESAKPDAPAPSSAKSTPVAKVEVPTTGVRSIKMPTVETELPNGPGKFMVISTCTLCHSQRYVLMQPNFPKKTWIAEVDKMKKVYGAPIQDAQVEPIVEYLVSVRGNGK